VESLSNATGQYQAVLYIKNWIKPTTNYDQISAPPISTPAKGFASIQQLSSEQMVHLDQNLHFQTYSMSKNQNITVNNENMSMGRHLNQLL
jgi:hypothetical protein